MESGLCSKTVDWVDYSPILESQSFQYNDDIIRLYTYEWTVNDFSFVKSCGADSPDFKAYKDDVAAVKLRLTPGDNRNELKISVLLSESNVADFKSNFMDFKEREVNLEFLDLSGKVLDYSKMKEVIKASIAYPENKPAEISPKNYLWEKEESMSRFVENNTLKFRVKISIRYFTGFKKCYISYTKRIGCLSNDMKKLIGGNFHSDLIIKVAGQTFSVHKCILLSQFDHVAKLSSELKHIPSTTEPEADSTKKTNQSHKTVFIPNEDSEVFQSTIYYLYTGKIPFRNKVNYFDLYDFAQKYQLNELARHLKPTDIRMQTQTQKLEIGFYWHVNDYNARSLDKFKHFKSPVYKISVGENEISWCVSMFFLDAESVFLSLHRVEGFNVDVHTYFRLIVCKPNGTSHEERDFEHNFKKQVPSFYPGFLDPESKFKITPTLLIDDTLIVRCEITVCNGPLTCFTSRVYNGSFSPFNFKMWLKNLQNLLHTGYLSDVSLIVDETEFKVHKAVLSARSPVFATMFETNMVEKINNIVKIEDISSATMKCVLNYIYTGIFDMLTISGAPELYRTADKYELFNLKEKCTEFILYNLDPEHACEVLILSDLYENEEMKKAAKDLILRNTSLSLLTDYGQDLMANHTDLAQDILNILSMAFCSLPPQDRFDKLKQNESILLHE